MKRTFLILLACAGLHPLSAKDDLIPILSAEMNRNLQVLKEQPVPAYYISYRVQDTENYNIQSSFGNIVNSMPQKFRMFHSSVRVGNHEMDNTREIKSDVSFNSYYQGAQMLVLDNNPESLKKALWKRTDELYKNAVKQYENVKANVAVTVAAEDQSNDFSEETGEKYHENPIPFNQLLGDVSAWEEKIKKYSRVFQENKELLSGDASLNIELVRKYFVDSDGAEITENAYGYRISLNASTIAEDGMELPLYQSWFAFDPNDLPSDEKIIEDAYRISRMLSELRNAPIADAYTGPALMTARASGVFFHEIFGHRVEGARLKQETDAQTFKKKVGEQILPKDFTVFFDPQLKEYGGLPVSGYYTFDDEGVQGQKVTIVENGILKSFLMSRTPIEGFPQSNGHGRGMIHFNTVTRQSNLIIKSNNPKSDTELRKMLIEEAKKNNQEYAYLFDEVAGGFTTTGRYSPNAFNVNPLVVYRVYVDGRPDELVRGVDLVGTPLSMFSQIAACGKDTDAFNGSCGAESGWIPVSCVCPTLFVKMIETQRKPKSQAQPPILERP